ncbi:MAG: hypothetical protein COA85_05360 [Robiginitomaculum sp.]|nr:MAG: hypothetical protein COA85_05360 [Robiginitomaculum sp.]
MSVAEAFSHFDANTMFDNALARVRRTIGVRHLPSTTSVRDYLDAQGLMTMAPSLNASSLEAANESAAKGKYHASTVGRRRSRRDRRAMRG